MPGYESEGEEIMEWMASNISRDVFVNIMDQYQPDAHVGKPKHPRRSSAGPTEPGGEPMPKEDLVTVRYDEINRHVSKDEVSTVRSAAEKAGLWRFCDPPKHAGFAI